MKKTISYVLISIFSAVLGAGLMYYLIEIKFDKKVDNNKVIESKVTVSDRGISSGIDNIYDSVVIIENYKKGKLSSIGSGFIYDKNGYIMTNQHVIENADEIKVTLSNKDVITSKVVGSDEYADIAILKIDTSKVIKVAKIGNSENTKVGDTVFAVGSPLSSDYAGTVTRGILSGKNRMVEVSTTKDNDWIMNVMQTDAAINPGNSGGPLCNVNGDVIGVSSLKIVKSEIEGIAFAIPIEDALEYANRIIKGEKIQRSYLGISMSNLSIPSYELKNKGITLDKNIENGVIVLDVLKDGPASKVDLKKGDVITKIDKYDVKNISELRYYLYRFRPNEKIKITLIREKTQKVVEITLGVNENLNE